MVSVKLSAAVSAFAVVASAQLPPVSNVQGWTLSGCYIVSDAMTFNAFRAITFITAPTVQTCLGACASSSSEYAGLAEGNCYCASNPFATGGLAAVSSSSSTLQACTRECDANPGFSCGGNRNPATGAPSAITLYRAGQVSTNPPSLLPPLEVPNWKYLGCYASDRLVGVNNNQRVVIEGTFTGAQCLATCRPSFAFGALSQGNCNCFDTFPHAEVAAAVFPPVTNTPVEVTRCQSPCNGAPTFQCGATSYAYSVYEWVQGAPPVSTVDPPVIITIPNRNVTIIDNTFITIVNIIYVQACAVCPGGVTTITVQKPTTVPNCNAACAQTYKPTIDLVTSVAVCNTCGPNGGPSTVTLARPAESLKTVVAVAPAPTTTPGSTPKPTAAVTPFIGAAPDLKALTPVAAIPLLGWLLALL